MNGHYNKQAQHQHFYSNRLIIKSILLFNKDEH